MGSVGMVMEESVNDCGSGIGNEDLSNGRRASENDDELPLPLKELRRIESLAALDHSSDKRFLISAIWWNQWEAYAQQDVNSHSDLVIPIFDDDSSRELAVHRPGPIDNTDLLVDKANIDVRNGFLELRPFLRVKEDFVLLTEKVWGQLFEWYKGGPILIRSTQTVASSSVESDSCDVDLYPFFIYIRYEEAITPMEISEEATLEELYDKVIALLNLEEERLDVQIWDFFLERKGRWPFFPKNYDTIMNANIRKRQQVLVEIALDTEIDEPSKQIRLAGCRGMKNLGNTCFMNSTLQCLFHIPQLVQYFSQDYEEEMNSKNQNGTKGKLASAFGALLCKAWLASESIIVPNLLRWRISALSKNFDLGIQHDAQELLVYLLNGLHDDVNRAKIGQQSIETSANGGSDDPADESWAMHTARNKSAIGDVFYGQSKSTLVCSICKMESGTYETFMSLSLPIPETRTSFTATVIHADGSDFPTIYRVSVPTQGLWNDLHRALSMKCGLKNHESLLIACVNSERQHFFTANLAERLPSFRVFEEYCIMAYRFPSPYEELPLLKFTRMRVYTDLWHGFGFLGVPLITFLPNDCFSTREMERAVIAFLKPFRMNDNGSDCGDDYYGLKDDSMEEDGLNKFGYGHLYPYQKLWYESDDEEYDTAIIDDDLCNVADQSFYTVLPQGEREDDSISLFSCLDAYLTEETLDTMWLCPRCKEQRIVTKKLDLWRLPNVLVFHFKRFYADTRGFMNKVDTEIEFPTRGLDLSKYMKDQTTSHVYELSAICNHYGRLHDGHYNAHAKLPDGTWALYDDGRVMAAEFGESISSSAAYFVFYQRVDSKKEERLNEAKEECGNIDGEKIQGNGVVEEEQVSETKEDSGAVDGEKIEGNSVVEREQVSETKEDDDPVDGIKIEGDSVVERELRIEAKEDGDSVDDGEKMKDPGFVAAQENGLR